MYASSENKNFSLNNITDRLNKIMNNLLEDFQNHFSMLKIGRIFPKIIFCEEYWVRRPTFTDFFSLKTLYFLKMCPISVSSVHNFAM